MCAHFLIGHVAYVSGHLGGRGRKRHPSAGTPDTVAPAPDDLISVTEAAQLLRVSATTVRNWSAEGRLDEHRTLGGHRRFRFADVERLARLVAPQRRSRVLVIDDDATIRFIVREAFTSVGFEVVEAGSALLGLDALDDDAPALVLLDIMMPGLDGFQVLKYLEQFQVDVPVLVFSALGNSVAAKAAEFGADDFVAKPFDVRELVVRCRRLIDARRAAAG